MQLDHFDRSFLVIGVANHMVNGLGEALPDWRRTDQTKIEANMQAWLDGVRHALVMALGRAEGEQAFDDALDVVLEQGAR